ncbi:MAG: glutathione synthetase [Rheinheimera sp.]|uniref:glutathione synthetase n=1 Tax=Arsukibacterium sp. UBA3155 TaxID=1946058 RepID=UPI000C97473B|nr:glutathione synthetase [Arsukibacterium sp. UBA3155]MAD76895.1 glutathione synthetase [Rheinheimera sp.]
MRICFLMYPWEKVMPDGDSTIRMIHEAVSRGHSVAITHANNLTVRDSIAQAFCKVVVKGQKISSNIASFYQKVEFNQQKLPLAAFDAIFIRLNPPLDPIVLNFLDSVREDTFIMNDLDGIRIANNKMYTASLHDPANEFTPITHVSKNKDYLARVLAESANDKMILKPLNGYGGKGVIVMEKSAVQSARSLLDFYIGDGDRGNYVILQEYVEGAEQGDIRILMLNGKPIGAMRRIPPPDDVRSNVHAGGTVLKHQLTEQEKKLCAHIGPRLARDGLFFAGIDVINGKLIEVNVMSPGGIARINRLNKVRLQEKVIDFIENIVENKQGVSPRKQVFQPLLAAAELQIDLE